MEQAGTDTPTRADIGRVSTKQAVWQDLAHGRLPNYDTLAQDVARDLLAYFIYHAIGRESPRGVYFAEPRLAFRDIRATILGAIDAEVERRLNR